MHPWSCCQRPKDRASRQSSTSGCLDPGNCRSRDADRSYGMRTARFARCCRWGRGCMAIEPHATPHGRTSPPRRPRSPGRLPPPALPCGRRPPDSGRVGGCVCSTATGAKPVPRTWSWRPRRLRHWLPGAPLVPACLSGSALSRSRGVGYLSHSTSSANACSENTSIVVAATTAQA
jgi:hypothetical protein